MSRIKRTILAESDKGRLLVKVEAPITMSDQTTYEFVCHEFWLNRRIYEDMQIQLEDGPADTENPNYRVKYNLTDQNAIALFNDLISRD